MIVADQVIAWSTPLGHWIWRCEDARTSNASGLLCTLSGDNQSDLELILNQHVVRDRSAFTLHRQHVLLEHDPDHDDRDAASFEWFYQRAGQGETMQSYRVFLRQLSKTAPRGSLVVRNAQPIGQSCSKDDRLPEMLFSDHGDLYRRRFGQGDLSQMTDFTIEAEAIRGQVLHDPLLVTVSRDAINPGCQRLDLLSLWFPSPRATVSGVHLVADPLMWSRWLFTCEQVDTEYQVLRREFPVTAMV